MIYKKSPEEISLMREGGKILVEALTRVESVIAPGVTTAELDRVFADAIAERGAKEVVVRWVGHRSSTRAVARFIGQLSRG